MSIDDLIDLICGPRYALAFFVLQLACSKVTILHPNFIISLSFWITSVWCGFIISYSAYKRIIKRSRINWNEEIAVVTGSSGGLGIAIVSALKAKGCRVVCIDIVQSKNTKVVDDDRTLYIQADLTDIKQVNALPGMIKSTFDRGSATIVISNAGVMIGRKVLDFEEGQFERTISVNFLATYHLVRAFLPDMLSSGRGHVVATSSILGYLGISQLTDYSASKHALIGFMESLRFELDKKYKTPGISTTLLILGKLSTPLFARTTISPMSQLFSPTQSPDRVAKALIDQLESGKGGYIYLPYLACFAPLLKAMPYTIRRAVQCASGADEALQAD